MRPYIPNSSAGVLPLPATLLDIAENDGSAEETRCELSSVFEPISAHPPLRYPIAATTTLLPLLAAKKRMRRRFERARNSRARRRTPLMPAVSASL